MVADWIGIVPKKSSVGGGRLSVNAEGRGWVAAGEAGHPRVRERGERGVRNTLLNTDLFHTTSSNRGISSRRSDV